MKIKVLFFISLLLLSFSQCKKQEPIKTLNNGSAIIKLLKTQGKFIHDTKQGKEYLIANKIVIVHNNHLKNSINYNKKLYATVDEENNVTSLKCEGQGDQCTVVKIDGKNTILVPDIY